MQTLGFLGAGKMASALARGFVAAGLTEPDRVVASDPFEAARELFQKSVGCRTTDNNRKVLEESDVLILAVKPNLVLSVLEEIRPDFHSRHLLISIAAGISLRTLEAGLNKESRVVRVMPNTPALVGASATGFAAGAAATSQDAALVRNLFSSVGTVVQLEEKLLDAVTGLSGSGPAFVYMIIEAMSDGGVAEGLPRDVATQLAAQTVWGSAKMVLETRLHPAVLKDMVASPGGTTIEGIHELEKGNVRSSLINAVRIAAEKSRQLGAQAIPPPLPQTES